MLDDFVMKFFVTRWVILAAMGLLVAVLINAYARRTGRGAAYEGAGFWWLYFLGLVALHTWTFYATASFTHWVVCVGAGLMMAFCAAALVRSIGTLMHVKMLRAYAVTTALLFPLPIHMGGERQLIDWINRLNFS